MRKTIGRSSNFVQPDPPPQPGGALIFERRFPAINETKNEVLNALLAALQDCGAIRSENDEVRMRLCLDEALVNAVMHGSKYNAAKNVSVRAYLDENQWAVLVEDEGSGFREEDLPDPDAQENLLEESGRGVHLIRTMMDSTSYWNGGRTLLMTKKR